jgi:predicted DsbA family dithiol-disulfide isomerase
LSTLHIDVVTDVVCPWCYIGLVRLDQAIAAQGIDAEIVHHPFFLDADTPPEGVDVAEKLRLRYGGDVASMFARVEGEAKKSGIALDLSKQPRQRPTAAAHALIAAAADRGTQHALAHALFEAHFMESRNVANPDVLAEIGATHGFTADEARTIATDAQRLAEVKQAAQSAAASGINGVPFFVFDRRMALSGCQPAEAFRQALSEAQAAVVE